MSDTEGGKKSGYRLEYAPSRQSKCNGPKPCKGTKIEKGELRVGSVVDFRGNTSFSWRHWGCVTARIISNMKESFEEADQLDGFDDLKEEDQEKVRTAWQEGKVAEEDIPESARKPEGEDGDDDDAEKPKKKGRSKNDADDDRGKKGVFQLEYASSGRAKCKSCNEQVGKDFFRIGQEVDFRGNKSFSWRHWGCSDAKLIASLKASYSEPSEIPGFANLKPSEQEKVQRAWDADAIPDEDKGAGEAVDTGKKAPARRKKNEDGEEKPKKPRTKKTKKDDDEDDEEEEEEKPKRKRAAPAKKERPAEKPKRASKKRKSEDDDDDEGEDFAKEIAAVGEDEDGEEEEEPASKKRKYVPASKGTSSKPPSKRAKPASKAETKPAAHKRGRKKEVIEEEDEDEE